MIENFLKSTKYVIDNTKILDKSITDDEKKYFDNLYNQAIDLQIPIVSKDVLKFILFLLNISESKKVLEIGSAIGYSTSFIAKNLSARNGELTSIEIDDKRYEIARKNIETQEFNKNVVLKHMDAMDFFKENSLDNKFDFIFIDAQKGKYKEFLEYSIKFLDKNGIIFIDNILFRSYVGDDPYDVPKKYRNMTVKMDLFIKEIITKYNATILPFGDGVGLISYKDIERR